MIIVTLKIYWRDDNVFCVPFVRQQKSFIKSMYVKEKKKVSSTFYIYIHIDSHILYIHRTDDDDVEWNINDILITIKKISEMFSQFTSKNQ